MKLNPHLLRLFCLLIFLAPVFAQESEKQKPQPIGTYDKEVSSQINIANHLLVEINGKLAFQATACNSDQSFTGIVTYQITETSRKKIADLTKKDLKNIPKKIEQKNVVVRFAQNTECPALKFKVSSLEIEFSEIKIHFADFLLDFKESQEEISALICKFAYRIKTGDTRHFSIRRLNELLYGIKSP